MNEIVSKEEIGELFYSILEKTKNSLGRKNLASLTVFLDNNKIGAQIVTLQMFKSNQILFWGNSLGTKGQGADMNCPAMLQVFQEEKPNLVIAIGKLAKIDSIEFTKKIWYSLSLERQEMYKKKYSNSEKSRWNDFFAVYKFELENLETIDVGRREGWHNGGSKYSIKKVL